MANGDLFTAIQLFNQEMDKLALQRTFTAANEQVQQIRASEASEADQRQQLRQLSDQVALQLGGMGAPATTIQTAQQTISPQDPREMLLFKHALELERDRAKAQLTPGKPLGEKALSDLGKIGDSAQTGHMLLERLRKDQSLVNVFQRLPGAQGTRRVFDKDFAAFYDQLERWFMEYRHRITGAQASDKELARLRRMFPSAGDPHDVFVSRVQVILDETDRITNRFLDTQELGGRDVSKFREHFRGIRKTPTPASRGTITDLGAGFKPFTGSK